MRWMWAELCSRINIGFSNNQDVGADALLEDENLIRLNAINNAIRETDFTKCF
jgi:hypothetical protein